MGRKIGTYVCMYGCVYVCMYVCIYVCMYVCMYGGMYVCMYVCIYVCVYVRMYMYVCTCVYVCMYICIYKGVSKSSGTVLVKRSLLTLDVKFLHYLQSTPLLHEYSGPSVSAMLGSIPGSPFWNCVKYPLRFLLNLFNGVELSTLHPKLQLGGEEEVTGGQLG